MLSSLTLAFIGHLAVTSSMAAVPKTQVKEAAGRSAVVLDAKGDAKQATDGEAGGHEAAQFKPYRQAVNGSTPTGFIQIGTPPKQLYVIFDTGSDKLVAKTWETVSEELSSVDQGVAGMVLPSLNIYDHNSSSTYHRKFLTNPFTGKQIPKQSSITYGSGTAITDEGTEDLIIGKRPLHNITLMEITQDSLGLLHTSTGVAGVMGLQHMKNKSLGHSLFSHLRDANEMTSFGYCRGNGNNGTFIWGDDSTEGHELKVLGQMHWAVQLGGVQITGRPEPKQGESLLARHATKSWPFDSESTGSDEDIGDELSKDLDDLESMIKVHTDVMKESCPDGKCTAILDTGSNIIAGPSAVIKSMTQLLGIKPDCSNFDSLPTIEMNFGGLPVKIPASGYVMKVPKPTFPAGMGDGAQADFGGHAGRHRSRHSDLEAGLAQDSDAASERAQTKRQWEDVFDNLNRDYGVDMRDMVKQLLDPEHHVMPKKFLCMPAFVPLDKTTPFGPLWVVGTPLLDEYYARWSFAKTDDAPKIHLKALQEAKVCKASEEPASTVLMRSHKESGSKLLTSASRGPIERLPEEIAYPHWAKDLLHV